MIPLQILKGWQPKVLQLTNVFVGMSSYAVSLNPAPSCPPSADSAGQYMFMVPLYLQAVRGDSPSAAGLRLIIPSLATPVGGVIAGSLMHRGCRLSHNVRVGTALMLIGNVLAWSMGTSGPRWKEYVYLVPANLGLGLTNPSVLFSFISLCQHRGESAKALPGTGSSPFSEQAVATSTVYLLRSMGTIYGVTTTTAIVQNVLIAQLPQTLGPDATDEVCAAAFSELDMSLLTLVSL